MASAAAAIMIRREKQIVEAFRQAGAVSADSAVRQEAIGVHHRIAFRKLRNRAVIREAAPDYFYLDEPSWIALRRLRMRMVGIMLVIALGVMIYIALFGSKTGA